MVVSKLWAVALCGFEAASTAPKQIFEAVNESNMNGDYLLSQTPGGHQTQEKFPTNYKDYPRGVRYFDLYSPPIKTLYSQVFWTGLEPVDLPEEVVKRYAGGKTMAIVGFELDQVRRTPKGDVSVPYNIAYNHHFESQMVGAKASLEKITLTGPHDPRIHKYHLNHGHCHTMNTAGSELYVVHDHEPDPATPNFASFGAANGGEARKSFHGWAPGFAQLVKSPEKFQITPMQIDTWNREKMNLTDSPFVAGPLPRSSLAPKNATYSGLLECPLTTRIHKNIEGDYVAVIAGACRHKIATASECFGAAAKQLDLVSNGLQVENHTVSDPTKPPACSLESSKDGGIVTVLFNSYKNSSAQCGASVKSRAGVTQSLVKLNVSMDIDVKKVTIAVSGPADVWFGVGFNASAMHDSPWAIIVDGYGNVTERKLQDQNPGEELPRTVSVISTAVVNGVRTVVMTRAMTGASDKYFSFKAGQDVVLPFINAIGRVKTLSFHKEKGPSSLALLPVKSGEGVGACLCPAHPEPFGQGKGTFVYTPVNQPGEGGEPTTIAFGNKCAPAPRSDLLDQHNPTCDVRTYVGGQATCHHMFTLLDADQEMPWVDQPLEYNLKFRFWYQDYDETYHKDVKRDTWGIASPVEYDVPKCAEGVKGCSKDEEGRWLHTITGTFQGHGQLVSAHFHCHAPTCISMKMYRNWNGTHGDLLCEERPVYGGTGKIDLPKFDEVGYINIPPCMWGSPEFGLEPPPDVTGSVLHTHKISHADAGHHGEMAWQQMFYVDPKPEVFV